MQGQVDNRTGPGWGARLVRGVLIFTAGVLVGANVVYYLAYTRGIGPPSLVGRAPSARSPEVAPQPSATAPGARPSVPAPMARAPTGPVATSPDGSHAVPVAGVLPGQLVDTFTQARGGGRVHDAIDIMAATGTPVVAAVDGRVVKLFASKGGGITLYQFDPAEEYVYYYAHLQGYAPGVVEGGLVRQGQVLGYVGYTGNADPSAPHLHFAIARLDPDKTWHGGTPINPFPLLSGRPAAPAAPVAAPVAAPAAVPDAATP